MSDHTRKYAQARSFRKKMTLEETLLWQSLRNQSLGVRFRRQHPVGPYILDFACLPLKIAVEADGGHHGSARDLARDAWLSEQGWLVLRFWNNEITGNLSGVIQAIETALLERQ